MKHIKCIIFDFGGVIADSDYSRFRILQNILINYNITFKKNDLIKLRGFSTKAFLINNFPDLSSKDIEEIIIKRHQEYNNNLKKYCKPFKNMNESIQQLSKYYELAIVTTNSIENIRIQLQHLQIFKYFKWVIGREYAEDNSLLKDYTNIPSIISRRVKECIVIEDSHNGIRLANKAGFHCIRFNPFQESINKEDFNDTVHNYDELINKFIS